MELAFDDKSLRTLCENETHARRELGSEVAEVLKRRLADMRAATFVNDLVAGRPRKLDGPDMAVDLCDGHRVVFCANHSSNPMTETGDLNWSKVSRVKILRIESDHG